MLSGRTANLEETIAALSSAAGAGLRAVVRVSGPAAISVVQRTVAGWIVDPIARRQVASATMSIPGAASSLPIDVLLFRAPNSYTGQDLTELHTLSSPPLVELLLSRLLSAGARMAQPGEFTLRGFLAGKLDLTRAEAVQAVVDATGADRLKQALDQLAGNLARPLDALRDDLLNLLADVEANLDFADEDISLVDPAHLLSRLTRALAQVTLVGKQIADRGRSGPVFTVALAGPPNAGKSSLFNALLGHDSAMVSPTAGTTRDVLESDLAIGGATIRLLDTAGLGDPRDAIDAQAQRLGRDRLEAADLVLLCQPVDELQEPAPPTTAAPIIRVRTKADLAPAVGSDFSVSVRHADTLVQMKRLLAEHAETHASSGLAPSLTRCRHHVDRCLDHLRRAHRLALEQDPAELLALELRLALDELGAMVGAVYTDDLLDRVFSRFCIGK